MTYQARFVPIFITIGLLLAGLPVASPATMRQVPAQFPNIQAALDASSTGDSVRVAPGTYSGTGNHDIFFHGKDLVLQSEDGPDVTIIDLGQGQNHGGFEFWYHETRAAVVEGFTIRNSYNHTNGGGTINCGGSSPTIRNCVVTDGAAYDYGAGGVTILQGSPLITGCVFVGNEGAIGFYYHSGGDVVDCVMEGNGGGYGAIVCQDDSNPTISRCVISGNWWNGLSLTSNQTIEVTNCEITRNYRLGAWSCNAHFVDCSITSNGGPNLGDGGIATFCTGTRLERSIIWGNCAPHGGDIYLDGSSVQLTCCAWPESGVYMGQYGGQIDSIGPQIHSDPRFCNPFPCPDFPPSPGGVYTLRSDSPCLPQFSPCGEQIGYYAQGCQAPSPIGACCFGADDCRLLTAQDCDAQHGNYMGDGVSCYPTPCVPTAVQTTTWGRIKARFR